MPCACQRCEQHAHTLGLAQGFLSRAAIRTAFKAAARLWHPDRFEKDPGQRGEAEEHFKLIQIAYRELLDHHQDPVAGLVEAGFPKTAPAPSISLGGAPGCFVAPDFSPNAERIIAAQIREPDHALAIVDLSGPASPPGALLQYILFTSHGIFTRDALNIVSLLWYEDLGEIRLLDKRRNGKLGLRHTLLERLSGTEQKYSLEIYRRSGTLFFTVASQVDDGIKKVVFNFLQQKKPQPHP